jgi:hypothetical protein
VLLKKKNILQFEEKWACVYAKSTKKRKKPANANLLRFVLCRNPLPQLRSNVVDSLTFQSALMPVAPHGFALQRAPWP